MITEQAGYIFLDVHTGNILCQCRFNRGMFLVSVKKSWSKAKKKHPILMYKVLSEKKATLTF